MYHVSLVLHGSEFTIIIENSEAKGHAKRIKFNTGLASYYFLPLVKIYPWIRTHMPISSSQELNQ